VIGFTYGFLIMLHDQDGVTALLKLSEGVKEHSIVPGMETNGGLVQNIAYAGQIGTKLRCQADPLGLTAREGIATSTQG
jgi:hypothetical protein